MQEFFGFEDVRLSLKNATLLRNQEFTAFYNKRLELDFRESLFTAQMDKFEAKVKFSEFS